MSGRRKGPDPLRRQRQSPNAAELLGQPNIDGALVGGASLKAADFWAIARGGCGCGEGVTQTFIWTEQSMSLVFQILLALVAIFLILLVLVQRGRGGGSAARSVVWAGRVPLAEGRRRVHSYYSGGGSRLDHSVHRGS